MCVKRFCRLLPAPGVRSDYRGLDISQAEQGDIKFSLKSGGNVRCS